MSWESGGETGRVAQEARIKPGLVLPTRAFGLVDSGNLRSIGRPQELPLRGARRRISAIRTAVQAHRAVLGRHGRSQGSQVAISGLRAAILTAWPENAPLETPGGHS